MASIHSNADITIYASGCHDSSQSLFSPRNDITTQEKSIDYLNGKEVFIATRLPHEATFVLRAPKGAQKDFALIERGWIYQEVYLSRRMLSFTKYAIEWMCNETFGCECNFHVFGQTVPKQLGKQGQTGFAHPVYKSRKWSEIVEAYSRRKFTFECSRLPTLAGIARYL